MNSYWPLIKEIAREMNIKPRTIEKWRDRRSVPHKYRLDFQDRAKAKRKRLPRGAFDA